MKSAVKAAMVASLCVVLSGCATQQWAERQYGDTRAGGSDELPPAPVASGYDTPAVYGAVSDSPVKLGEAYSIGDQSYTPVDDPMYDTVGYASWYGAESAGRPTANGEMFNPAGISAAHKTLPLPSYVEVTRLDTGKTIVVRVNDRGPFAHDRLIDLSEGAARQLGIVEQGSVGVRVRRINLVESEKAQLRRGLPVQERMAPPEQLLGILRNKLSALPKPSGQSVAMSPPKQAPSRTVSTAPQPATGAGSGRFVVEGGGVPLDNYPGYGTTYGEPGSKPAKAKAPAVQGSVPSGGFVVQIASYASRDRAEDAAQKAGARVMPSEDGSLFRVRYGPFATEAEAQAALAKAQQRGYASARIFRN